MDVSGVVAGHEVSLVDVVGAADGLVAETQVADGHAAGLLGVILEVCLNILISVVADDLDGVLVSTDGTVAAQTPELALLGASCCGDGSGLDLRQRQAGDIIGDAEGEALLRLAELPLELINNGFVRNSDAMISFIKGLVAKYDFNARHAVFTVGGRNAFVREIDMPEMPDEEMKQSVAWDSSQYVPYEADTYYVDSAKFGAYTNEGLQPVLLVASPKDVIDSLLEISDALAWHTIGIDIEVLSAYRTLPRQLENFVLLDIGRSYSMLTIFQNGAPVAQRSIPQGGQMFNAAIANGAGVDLTAAEKIKLEDELLLSSLETDKTKFAEFFNEVENLGREVRRTCEYYLINKKDARFTHLVLAGGGANMAGLSEFLSEGMEMKVVVNDLRQAVTFADKLDQRELKKYLGALTVAIGAALYGGEADD